MYPDDAPRPSTYPWGACNEGTCTCGAIYHGARRGVRIVTVHEDTVLEGEQFANMRLIMVAPQLRDALYKLWNELLEIFQAQRDPLAVGRFLEEHRDIIELMSHLQMTREQLERYLDAGADHITPNFDEEVARYTPRDATLTAYSYNDGLEVRRVPRGRFTEAISATWVNPPENEPNPPAWEYGSVEPPILQRAHFADRSQISDDFLRHVGRLLAGTDTEEEE